LEVCKMQAFSFLRVPHSALNHKMHRPDYRNPANRPPAGLRDRRNWYSWLEV